MVAVGPKDIAVQGARCSFGVMMDWHVKAFLRAGLLWLGLGVLVGLVMAAAPQYAALRPAHAHISVVGFAVSFIYGVAYHVIPRFSGHPLYSPRMAVWHVWLANGGLAVMVAAFAWPALTGRPAMEVLTAGGMAVGCGAFLFIINLWRTLGGPRALRHPAMRPGGPGPRRLDVVQPGS
jgi:cbb3-type cytochrome oxidase subunit 1